MIMIDKKYHVLAGLLVAAFVGLPAYLESLNLFAGLWSALTSGIIAGGVKEWCDNQFGGGVDWKDCAATVLGGLVVVLLILGLHFGRG
jgi:hypothetical protein